MLSRSAVTQHAKEHLTLRNCCCFLARMTQTMPNEWAAERLLRSHHCPMQRTCPCPPSGPLPFKALSPRAVIPACNENLCPWAPQSILPPNQPVSTTTLPAPVPLALPSGFPDSNQPVALVQSPPAPPSCSPPEHALLTLPPPLSLPSLIPSCPIAP